MRRLKEEMFKLFQGPNYSDRYSAARRVMLAVSLVDRKEERNSDHQKDQPMAEK
jgi:hypothetical protein